MQKIEPLVYGKFYHIYNCGINGERIFRDDMNYEYFLHLYNLHITQAADTFAWCLMGNHFHLLVRMKEKNEINIIIPDKIQNTVRGTDTKIKPPHQYFSNLFNSYTQAFNKMYSRHGGLFERPFKRKLIESDEYLKQVVVYIHNNPVHHKFCSHPLEYDWSSYKTYISAEPTALKRDIVITWFDNINNFIVVHKEMSTMTNNEIYIEF